MKTFCYVLRLTERLYEDAAWTKTDNDIINDHYNRIKSDFEKGKILHVGKTRDPRYPGFGLVVFQAQNEQEAQEYRSQDPAIAKGLMTGQVHEYQLIFQ